MRMTIPRLAKATFDELKAEKIRLRRMGRKCGVKHGVMYANVELEMKRRFGRT